MLSAIPSGCQELFDLVPVSKGRVREPMRAASRISARCTWSTKSLSECTRYRSLLNFSPVDAVKAGVLGQSGRRIIDRLVSNAAGSISRDD